MTLRAFTSGYDLFHPVENVVWHDYVRAYAVRHWEDHSAPEPSALKAETTSWNELDRISKEKVRLLLQKDSTEGKAGDANLLGAHGLGSTRTLEEYEVYAGVSFEKRKMQDYTRYGYEAPNPSGPDDWAERIYNWLVRVAIDAKSLPAEALEEHSCWVVAIQDEDRREIRRHDFQREDLVIKETESTIVLIFEIQSGIIPAFWSLWPLRRLGGGGPRLEGALADSDFSIITD